jgi:hypothetical protein
MQGLCSQRATSQTPDNVLPQARAGLSPARSPLYCSTVYCSTLSRSAAHGIPPISHCSTVYCSTFSRSVSPARSPPNCSTVDRSTLSRSAQSKTPISEISNLKSVPKSTPFTSYLLSTIHRSTLSRSAARGIPPISLLLHCLLFYFLAQPPSLLSTLYFPLLYFLAQRRPRDSPDFPTAPLSTVLLSRAAPRLQHEPGCPQPDLPLLLHYLLLYSLAKRVPSPIFPHIFTLLLYCPLLYSLAKRHPRKSPSFPTAPLSTALLSREAPPSLLQKPPPQLQLQPEFPECQCLRPKANSKMSSSGSFAI